jgi:hypothetical protein
MSMRPPDSHASMHPPDSHVSTRLTGVLFMNADSMLMGNMNRMITRPRGSDTPFFAPVQWGGECAACAQMKCQCEGETMCAQAMSVRACEEGR